MSFLAPLFLLGALAVAGPILFHLIRRAAKEKKPFSSLMFLEPSPPRITRRRKLENLLLLALRCLILALLAFAFARPFLFRPVEAESAPGEGKRLVVLVDASASMRRDGLWSSAQERVERVLRQTSPADEVAVLLFDHTVRTLISFEQWRGRAPGERVSRAAQELAAMQPGWGATHLDTALTRAVEWLEDASGQQVEAAVRQVVLISDVQDGARLDALQNFNWPAEVSLILEPLAARRPTNAGLQLVHDASSGDGIWPRVRISNAAESKREQFKVGWAGTDVGGFMGAPAEVYIPPGQSRVIAAPKTTGGLPGSRLVLTGDDEDFDNTVFFTPPQIEPARLLYASSDEESNPAQMLYYLKLAFAREHGLRVQVMGRPAGGNWSAEELKSAGMLILAQPLPANAVEAVRRYLADGKTALLVLANEAMGPTLAAVSGKPQLRVSEATVPRYAMLSQMDFEHPLLAPFADPRYGDFTKIHFWKHRRVELESAPEARVLARFDSGDPALVELAVGQGSLLVLTAGWHPTDSQLALSSKFVPLLHSILEWGGALQTHRAHYAIGDVLPMPASRSGTMTLRKPDGQEITVIPDEPFRETDLPGVYTITSTQPPISFAVNLAANESRTAPLPPEQLQRLGVTLHTTEAATPARAEEKARQLQSTQLESRQKLWRWLIFAALLIAIAETWLAGRASRTAVTLATDEPANAAAATPSKV